MSRPFHLLHSEHQLFELMHFYARHDLVYTVMISGRLVRT